MECADDSCTEEVLLEGQLFCNEHRSQISAIEDLQCPRGCGRLSYETGWSDPDLHTMSPMVRSFFLFMGKLVISGLALLIAGGIAVIAGDTESYCLLLVAIPVALFAFLMLFMRAEGDTGYHKCDMCHGEMYDSKTIVKMMPGDKAKTIERLLESGTPSANKRQCPGCGAGMERIPIDYVEPDLSSGHHGHSLVISVIDAMIPNPTHHLDLDGCETCGLFWFDSKELAKITKSKSMKGGS